MSRYLFLAQQSIEESIRVKEELLRSGTGTIVSMAEASSAAFREGRRIYLFGNGGSAADAQHLAAELVNRLDRERKALPALALTVDTSVLTSIGNDYRFEDIFVRQIQAFGAPGDVAFGISTSGKSPNVIAALKWARLNGLRTIGFAGAERTEMDDLCDLILHVAARSAARVQETHITAGHVLCALIEEMLFGGVE